MASIYHIRGRDELRVEGFEAVSDTMTDYYKELLGSTFQHRVRIDKTVIELGSTLTVEQ